MASSPTKPVLTHLRALKEAFKRIQAEGAIARINCGMTQRAGWEALTEACARKGLPRPIGLFWHNQSHAAFEAKTGVLLSDLHIYWAGDARRYCDALREQGLDVVEPKSEDDAIRVRPTPLPGMKSRDLPGLGKASPEALQRVFDDPDSDAPRLALAEELERRKDPRAAFIRLQHEYRTKGQLSRAKFKELEDLHRRYEKDFAEPLGLKGGATTNYCSFAQSFEDYARVDFGLKFRSGFVFSTMLPGEDREWDDEKQQWILNAPAPDIPFDSPWWSTVRHVEIHDHEDFSKLQASSAARRIEALKVTSAEWLAGADASAFPALVELHVRMPEADFDWTALKRLLQLVRLVVNDENVHDGILDVGTSMPDLREVHFRSTEVYDAVYTRDGENRFTLLETSAQWPYARDDIDTVLSSFAERLSMRTRRVIVGRQRGQFEGPITRELNKISAMFRGALPHAEVVLAASAPKRKAAPSKKKAPAKKAPVKVKRRSR